MNKSSATTYENLFAELKEYAEDTFDDDYSDRDVFVFLRIYQFQFHFDGVSVADRRMVDGNATSGVAGNRQQ